MSPYFQLREKFKCIELTKVKPKVKLLPKSRKSEQNVSQFQIPTFNPDTITEQGMNPQKITPQSTKKQRQQDLGMQN